MRWQMTSASTCSSEGPAEPNSGSSSDPSGLSDLAAAGGWLAGSVLNDSGAARLVTREGFPAPPAQSCSSLRSPALDPPKSSLQSMVLESPGRSSIQRHQLKLYITNPSITCIDIESCSKGCYERGLLEALVCVQAQTENESLLLETSLDFRIQS